MPKVSLDANLWREPRFLAFCQSMGWSAATGLGALALLWQQSREAGFVRGSAAELFVHLPVEAPQRNALMQALLKHGYVTREEAGVFAIEGNAEDARLRAQRAAAGRKGRSKTTLVKKERAAQRRASTPKAVAKPARTRAVAKQDKAITPYQEANRQTWEAYKTAYVARWQTEPLRNARVNACIAQIVQRVGREAAPRLMVFFVAHPDREYIRSHHAVTIAVRDAESLHTQMQLGRPLTTQELASYDRTSVLQQQLFRLQGRST